MKYGTPYFKSFEAAMRYYDTYGYSAEDVVNMLDDGDILIGKPQIPPGARLSLEAGRYIVEERISE